MLDSRIAIARMALDEAQEEYDATVKHVQAECSHPDASVVVGQYDPGSHYMRASGSLLVCSLCGFAEDGWGSSYVLGKSRYRDMRLHVPREQARVLVIGKVHG